MEDEDIDEVIEYLKEQTDLEFVFLSAWQGKDTTAYLITDNDFYTSDEGFGTYEECPISKDTAELDKRLKEFCEKFKIEFEPVWYIGCTYD